ncbi:uncharacterized protein LOC116117635 [Pistacia vera]|uniref:uncharacterized protein LOC116117633 n=1 Tax=Pistacia vera TaxID=55513 RepID=UPI00126318CB|nr:uncharacterized protein LOC116117633 [Pistacia vera]XP_031259519.1 uncharacterized protein LOC116117635 [Pistacia vera]
MAASSPALSNNTSDTHTATAANLHRDTPPKTLRGLNKPKCIQCGNVARSRCPYQSCKSCCSKAQNPCHIHVLKANATFPDKAPTSSSPSLEQKSSDVSPAGNSLRVASLRQLSSNFAQFNNVQMPLRSRKPLTRKDASVINEWRFSKLKEYKDRNIEVENEAFDHYMQNISLLEEVFSVKSILEEFNEDESSISNPNSTSVEEDSEMMISGLKLKLKSNPKRSENFRRRTEQIVDQGLEKFQNFGLNNDDNDELSDQSEVEKSPKKAKFWWSEKASALSDIIDKLNKARSEEDPKSYLKLKSQLYNLHTVSSQSETEDGVATKEAQELTEKNDLEPRKESGYSLPKLFTTTEIDQETITNVDVHFSSLEKIEDL